MKYEIEKHIFSKEIYKSQRRLSIREQAAKEMLIQQQLRKKLASNL